MCTSSSELVHQIAPIGTTFLKQSRAQKRTLTTSKGKGKRQQVDPPQGDVQINPFMDPIVEAKDGDEDTPIASTSKAALSLCYAKESARDLVVHHTMIETFITTQDAHGQLLESLIIDVATFRVEFN